MNEFPACEDVPGLSSCVCQAVAWTAQMQFFPWLCANAKGAGHSVTLITQFCLLGTVQFILSAYSWERHKSLIIS